MSDNFDSFSITINPNYTVSVFDLRKRELIFRDIVGSDLEYIENYIEKSKEPGSNSLDHIISILQIINTQNLNFSQFSKKTLCLLFQIVNKHILCNFVTKVEWLKICYVIQKGSFANVLEMEKVPMSKFITMHKIHLELMESTPPDLE